MDKYVLIVAGGSGSRFNESLPKQFVPVNGKPLLMWTFEAFRHLLPEARFVLVLNHLLIGRWKQLCSEHRFEIPHQLIEGGPKRYHSVKVGLSVVPKESLVAIHDGARPCVNRALIDNCFDVALRKGNAIPAIPVSSSLRQVDGPLNKKVDREQYRIVQTPQTFRASHIKKAYLQTFHESFTDDASILESDGRQINLVEGDPLNIKLTTPHQLVFISAILNDQHLSGE